MTVGIDHLLGSILLGYPREGTFHLPDGRRRIVKKHQKLLITCGLRRLKRDSKTFCLPLADFQEMLDGIFSLVTVALRAHQSIALIDGKIILEKEKAAMQKRKAELDAIFNDS